jgi:tetratricopeptide (TPR) repeat protein
MQNCAHALILSCKACVVRYQNFCMKRIGMTVALFIALGGVEARAAETVSTQGWCQYGGQDFTVISQLSVSDTAAWTDRFDQFLHAIKGRLWGDPRILGPFTVVLFGNRSDFWNSEPRLKSGEPVMDIGAFSRSGDWGAIAAVCVQGADEDTQRVMFQSGVDWLLSADSRYRPPALTNGLSAAYGAYVVDGGREVFGRPIPGWNAFLQRAATHPLENSDRFLKIEDLLAVRDLNAVADRHGINVYFAESFGFAQYLLFSPDMLKQRAMEKLLAAFDHTRNPHDALRVAFGRDADTLDSRFYNFICGGDFDQYLVPLEQMAMTGSPAPADPAAVAGALANLEASMGNLDEARSYALQAIQLKPGDARSHDALALVDFMEGRHAETAEDCREAIRLNTRDGWTWFEASQEVGMTDAANTGTPVLLSPEQVREAVVASERAILFRHGLKSAYERIAALISGADHVTVDDGKFLVLGRTLFPNDGWIEIGHAAWALRYYKDRTLPLKIIDDVLSRSAALTPEEIAKAKLLRKEWTGPSE